MESIRAHDREDLEATGIDPVLLVASCLEASAETLVYRDDEGKLLALLGKGEASIEAPGRSVWMLGTEGLYKGYVRSLLMQESKRVIGEWLSAHGLLHNAVYEKNAVSIRYLTWLGARWLPEPLYGNGKIFYRFYISKEE